MLKRFFISMLGTMAGLWISVFLLFLCGMLLIGSLAGSTDDNKNKRSILRLDLSNTIAERKQPASLMEMIQQVENNAPSLDEMLKALNKAADDENIEALFLDCGGSAMGMASRQELLEAIRDFKLNSGKPVYAYADSYAQGDYLLATVADSIYLNPIGAVDIHGMGGMTPFFKNLLDKLGVKMQILKVGTFKSAVEPFILTDMSEPARLQMQQYCDSLWHYTASSIADSRAIETDTIKAWASEMIMTLPAANFVEMGLVDHLVYRRHMDDVFRNLTGTEEGKDVNYLSPSEYLAVPDLSALEQENEHVAILYAVGDIVDTGEGGIVGDVMAPEIIELANDDDVRGLVLRVNSGGGSAFASEQIWEALEYFKSKGKPFYVSMGDYAASGGYYISCGADRIFADETTITGSIGVFGMIPDLSGLVGDKFGINFSTVETNPNAAGISLVAPMTPVQAQAMQRNVENTYALFTSRVATGREMSVDSVCAIAEGRVWVGSKAIELGLVDEMGSLADAVDAITAELDMQHSQTVAYPIAEEELWMQILSESGIQIDQNTPSALTGLDAETLETLRTIRSLRTMNPIQARMETVLFR